jgi:glycosyltransferase involved in cell wall biosynthesis
MRVLHVVQGYAPAIGGTEYWAQKVSEKLVSRHGDQVTVFTTTAAHNCNVFTNPFYRQLRPGVETINGVTVRRFPVFNLMGPALFYVQRLYGALQLPRDDYLRALYCGPIIWNMTREIARFPCDVVAASSFPLLHMHYAVAAKRKSGVPTVLYGGLHPEEPWAFDQQIIYDTIRQADAYMANTTYERDYVLDKGIEGAKVRVTATGVDPAAFAQANGHIVRERYGWGNDPVVAFIGQQVEHKGADTLVLAMPIVWREFPTARLLIAGSRTRFSKVIRWRISQLSRMQQRLVTVVDNFIEADKPHLFDACDVFAYPSGFESFGLAFLEAWVRGKPVIGCRAGAVPSVIDEGRDGLLVRYKDRGELAQAVLALLRNPALRREMGERGRQKALIHYTWDAVSDRIREVYQDVIQDPS